MCDPVVAPLMIASAASQFAGQQQQYKAGRRHQSEMAQYQADALAQNTEYRDAQVHHRNAMYLENAKIASGNARDQYQTLLGRIDQEREAASFEINKVGRDARKLQSSAVTAATEGGVTGSSVDLLLADIERSENEYANMVAINHERRAQQIMHEMTGVEAQAQGQIMSMTPQPTSPLAMPEPMRGIAPPNPFAIATGAMSQLMMVPGMSDKFAGMFSRGTPTGAAGATTSASTAYSLAPGYGYGMSARSSTYKSQW